MASLMDTLSGLARQVADSARSGGPGGLLEHITGAVGGQARKPARTTSEALGMGGMLGSAALGSVLGALFTNSTFRKTAGSGLALGGGALAATLAWKYFQKWNAENSRPAEQQTTHAGTPEAAPPSTDPWGKPISAAGAQPAAAQEDLAETLLMAMIFAARSDGRMDEREKANIDTALKNMSAGGDAQRKLLALMDRPVNPQDLADRVHTQEEAEDVYRLSCLIVDIDQYMERSYMDGLAKALRLSDAQKNDLERQAEDLRQQAEPRNA